MAGYLEDMSFGELVSELRKKKGWTVKDFIKKLESVGGKSISPAYITRVEQYGEIPSPEVICIMAEVLGYDVKKLLDKAKRIKIKRFDTSLEEKYQKAMGLYRKQKGMD